MSKMEKLKELCNIDEVKELHKLGYPTLQGDEPGITLDSTNPSEIQITGLKPNSDTGTREEQTGAVTKNNCPEDTKE